MIKDSLRDIGNSARGLFRNPLGLLLLCALYLATLVCLYAFFNTGLATTWQLILTALTAVAAPVLFFLLQTAVANFAQAETTFGALVRRTLRDFLKVVLIGIPLVALAVGFIYLLGKLQAHLPKVEEAPHAIVATTLAPKPEPLHWQDALVSSLWLLLLGIVLPIIAAHLWLSTARDGLVFTLKKIHRVVGRAFAPRPFFIYVVGLFVFGLMPYFILYTRTPVSNGWAELSLFALRLALAFLFTLLGWTITLGALARATPPPETIPVAAPLPAESVTTPAESVVAETETRDAAA
jgi:hypothetical protein